MQTVSKSLSFWKGIHYNNNKAASKNVVSKYLICKFVNPSTQILRGITWIIGQKRPRISQIILISTDRRQ